MRALNRLLVLLVLVFVLFVFLPLFLLVLLILVVCLRLALLCVHLFGLLTEYSLFLFLATHVSKAKAEQLSPKRSSCQQEDGAGFLTHYWVSSAKLNKGMLRT